MDILISVATKLAELIMEPIGRQVGYLLCYRNYFKELSDKVEELQTTKERIDHEVSQEIRNGREIEGDVLAWQESVIKTLNEVKKLCGDARNTNVGCSKWSFPNLKSRYQLSRKVKKMVNTIIKMKEKGIFARVGYVRHLNITKNFPTTKGISELESRNLVKKEVVSSLKDPKVNKIGVFGISGVGKTTLVQEVAKQVKDEKLFNEVVFVTISQTNLERIQDDIAEQLDLHLKEMTSSIIRANCLCERIEREKNILIILDDIWEEINLEKLGIPFLDIWGKISSDKLGSHSKDDYKGCKLLLTSRSQDILLKNETQKNFSLQILNDVESWRIFEAMVGDIVHDASFQTIATQVAQKCLGLPILIVTIAKSLKDKKNIHYWKDTLNNLKSIDNKDVRDILLSSLEFNLNRLEVDMKEVFLLCGVRGTSMMVNDLLKYAIGLGIFNGINTIEGARNRLYRIIDDLKASCLLVDDDSRVEFVKMHDIVREVAILIASKEVFTRINTKWQSWLGNDVPKTCTHIILDCCCIQKLPERLDCPYLTFLHIDSSDNRTLKIPGSFFEGMGNLEALDLTGLIIFSLPISLSTLIKLKTLCLDQCSLKDMSGIGSLINLEILSFIYSSIEEFPCEIGQLTNLRMLDLGNSGIKTFLPNILCKLTKLEELYIGNTIINWEVETSTEQKRNASLIELCHLKKLTTLEIQIHEPWLLLKEIPFDNLVRYKVIIGDKWEWSSSEETSRVLKVKLDTNIRKERGINTLIEGAEDLYLDKINGIPNVFFELNGKGFPLLKHLHIQNNGEIKYVINSIVKRDQTHVSFPKLETLILHNLNNLVKICDGPIRDNSFGRLMVVKVKSCNQLVYLFSISMIKAFSQLVEIEVSECSSMKKIVFVESADSGKSIDEKIEFLSLRSLTLYHLPTTGNFCSHELTSLQSTKQNSWRANIPTPFFSNKVKFSNLETLKLSSVNLKKIWEDHQSSAPYLVQNLANLTVENCGGLTYLFSSSMIGRLLNLKQLKISKCDMMGEIIATDGRNGSAIGEALFPKLEAIIIKDMKNLTTMWHRILASNSLASFKTLEVKNCEKIEKILPEYMSKAFATLETLKVEDCKLVQEIFQLGVNANDIMTQLKYITLRRLPQLKQIWSKDPQSCLRFENLQVVCVKECEVLEYLFPFSIALDLPQLEQIIINEAQNMKHIVSKKEGTLDSPARFEFNQLKSLVLWDLEDLEGFCLENHTFACWSLKELNVYNCVKLKLFKTQCQEGVCDNNLQVPMQQPLFTLEELICNLEELNLNNEDDRMALQWQISRDHSCKLKLLWLCNIEDAQANFLYWILQNITCLEWLVIEANSSKVIFQDEMPKDEKGQSDIKAQLKRLSLSNMVELQHICKEGFQSNLILEALEHLDVYNCSNLKLLVPSFVTFNRLTYLDVENCNGLIAVITTSTARSLAMLTTLKIRACKSIEQIVAQEGGEGTNNEIAFDSLEVLELESLPKLKTFCSSSCSLKVPLLEKLVIRQCARMKRFSTSDTSAPLLQRILTDDQDEKWFCEGDLNGTVKKIFQHMVAFRSLERLELFQYPEFTEMSKPTSTCSIEQVLKVDKCQQLKSLFSISLCQGLRQLEELNIESCDGVKEIVANEGLEELTLDFPRLNC
ncbi:probable disease resistance protein At4g27220 isoform X3 [Prosopis cineraria]|uniref:probable disease resistance protein At4g27220 isoform X3 n=1 Tax=Prosopis cineraria TaxID=364024 RepID=UPI00240F257C|nr:probable disease resistance protein At4g27220 isoform X3 [Prosopis cineraria]